VALAFLTLTACATPSALRRPPSRPAMAAPTSANPLPAYVRPGDHDPGADG
jgi:hypothetical protein